ncbi:MAG: hypothetical protein VKI42_02940 [Synechococcaceae cyanobacterium]|nr:hypothetical protein [Synechococcaceae cyanobacterium]
MNPSLLRWRPIGVCLLAAVLLHSLALAMLHLQRQRLKPAPASALSDARPADDTPELLRFSRHQSERAAPSIVPLPGFDQLPPPPPLAASAAGPGAAAKSKGLLDFKPQKPGVGGRSGRGANVAAQQRRASQVRHGGPVSSGQARALAELETPAVLLERLRRLALESPEPRPVAEPPVGGGPSGSRGGPGEAEAPLRRPEGAALQPYQALWEGAQSETGSPAGVSALPAMLERRSLPLAQARRGGLPINHGEGVLLGDQLLLFWIQGDQLWLLRSKVSGG